MYCAAAAVAAAEYWRQLHYPYADTKRLLWWRWKRVAMVWSNDAVAAALADAGHVVGAVTTTWTAPVRDAVVADGPVERWLVRTRFRCSCTGNCWWRVDFGGSSCTDGWISNVC